MNNLIKAIQSHRSIRKYKNDLIPESVMNQILNAASRASSSGNMQAYSIIVTTDPELKQELYGSHFKQSMVLEAPVLLTFCADFRRMRKWLEINDAPDNFDNFMSFMIATIDATLASQNAALAAESLGLGICYLGTTLASCDSIAKILNCPEGVVPVVGFAMGYPDEGASCRERLPLSAVIHKDKYEDKSAKEIQEFYQNKNETGMRRYLESADLKQQIEEAGASNLAQIYTKVKYTRESHVEYSRIVLGCLRRQGFLNHLNKTKTPV